MGVGVSVGVGVGVGEVGLTAVCDKTGSGGPGSGVLFAGCKRSRESPRPERIRMNPRTRRNGHMAIL